MIVEKAGKTYLDKHKHLFHFIIMKINWKSLIKHNIILFLSAEVCKPVEIHQRMFAVYREKCVSKTTVMDWSGMFHDGHEEMIDLEHPGQTHKVVIKALIVDIDNVVEMKHSWLAK